MKRILPLAIILCFTLSITASTSSYNTSTDIEAYGFEQPINRTILSKNQLNNITPTQDISGYNDPYLSLQWAISQTNVNKVWNEATENNSVIVAVIDTGVDYTHDDLENRVLVDLGYDFANDDNDPMDDNGHGTHVSGIIAAEANNKIGIAGIAGELDVNILPIKALDADGAGQTLDITHAILYAVDMQSDIINLSLGSNTITEDILSAIKIALEEDIFIVVAAGNDSYLCAPTSLANVDGVFTVAATDKTDSLAYFSNFGSCIDAYAPGTNILSTYLDNQYAYQDGTSMAAPIVSGAAAILLSQNPDLSIEELTDILSHTYSVNNTPTSTATLYSNNSILLRSSRTTTQTSQSSSFDPCSAINIYNAFSSAL